MYYVLAIVMVARCRAKTIVFYMEFFFWNKFLRRLLTDVLETVPNGVVIAPIENVLFSCFLSVGS